MKNCSTCSKYLKCKDPNKGPSYVCKKYKAFSNKQDELFTEFAKKNKLFDGKLKIEDAQEKERKDLKDLEKLLKEALDPQNAIAPDLKIDDSDIPLAANFYEFCIDKVNGLDQTPLPRQFQIYTHLFAEWCPKCSSSKFNDFDEFPVDFDLSNVYNKITLLRYGKCPNCKRTRRDLIKKGHLNDYIELALCAGQRSGKTIGTSLANAYIIHRYLKLQNPAQVFNQTKNTRFVATMVALTFQRAKDLLYVPFINLVETSPWYKQYHELMDFYQKKYGEEIYYSGKEGLIYKHRGLFIHPMNPSKRLLRGDSRILANIDELGWFPFGNESDTRERAGADEVYKSLDRSLATIRLAYDANMKKGYYNIPNAYGIFASSPSAYNDKIMSLVRNFQTHNFSLGIQLPSWEMNPHIKKNSRIIQKAYSEDPVKSERDFGANPPMADSAFISDVTEFLDCFKKRKNVLANYVYTFHKGISTTRSARFKRLPMLSTPSIMALDSGYSNNSFAMVVGNLKNFQPQITGIIEIAPEYNKKLNHSYIYQNIIWPVIKALNVVRVYVDRWQSIKIIQDIEKDTMSEDEGLPTCEGVQYSLKHTQKYSDFEFVLDYMRDPDYAPELPSLECNYNEIMNKDANKYPHSYRYQPVSHLLFQMATVRATLKTIEKGQGYTDDIFRALMLALTHLYNPEVVEWLKKKSDNVILDRGLAFSNLYSARKKVEYEPTISAHGLQNLSERSSIVVGMSSRSRKVY